VERIAAVVASSLKTLSGTTSVASSAVHARTSSPAVRRSTGSAIRVGIVGCGQMGRWHFDSYKSDPRVELVGFVDTAFDRAEQFAREAGGRAFRSHTELLAQEKLDAVSVCTVPSTHRTVAIDSLEAGVHVLCEKPLAISVREAEEMSRKAAETKRLLFTAFKFRFHDEVRKAKELIDSGSLGRILSFRLMFGGYIDMHGQWYAQKALAGGGIIMDNGPHAADLMRYLFGDVRTISAEVARIQDLEVEDTAKLDVRMENETVGTTDLSWCMRIPPRSYLEIYGEDGAASLDTQGISYKFKTWSQWKRDENELDVKGAFARQIHYFIDAVAGQNPLALGNGEGVASQRVIEAAYASIEQDRKIDLAGLRA
jgi:predicted dehydrogenase